MNGAVFSHPEPPGVPEAGPDYFRWTAPNCPVIAIRTPVLEGIHAEVLQGLNAVPRRGAEVGGILLGSWAGEEIIIEDFEPVPCEHRFGPSYQLSKTDLQNLDETCLWFRNQAGAGLSLVGLYRSHTRPDFGLAAEDRRLLSTYFADPRQVLLLIKPSRLQHSVADFFMWRRGEIEEAAYPQPFPFRSSRVEPGAELRSRPVIVGAERQPAVEPPQPEPASPPPEPRTRHIARVVLDGFIADNGAAVVEPSPTPPVEGPQTARPEFERPFEMEPATEAEPPVPYRLWALCALLLAIIGGVLGYLSVDSKPAPRDQGSPPAAASSSTRPAPPSPSETEKAGRPSPMPAQTGPHN